MCPYPMDIQDNRFLFALPCSSYPPGQKCIIGKNVQNFFWWSEFLLSDAPLLQVIIAGTSKKTGAKIKKLSHLPASISQISRSTPPLLHPSTKNDVFLITLYAATYWKNGIHDNAGNGIVLLANAISGIGCNKKWKKNPSNEGEKTEVQPNDRHKKNPTGNRAFLCFPALSWWLWLEWNCLQPTPKNNRYDRQCKSKYRESAPYNGVNGWLIC